MADRMSSTSVPAHHRAWLDHHPNRSSDWLRARIADGFDIHHIDGDPTNNSPENLALIEHDDHMRIHAAPLFSRLRVLPLNEQPARRAKKRRTRAHQWVDKYVESLRRKEAKARKEWA